MYKALPFVKVFFPLLLMGHAQIMWVKIEFWVLWVGNYHSCSVHLIHWKIPPFYLCGIYKVFMAWPCWKLEWDRIRRFGKCLKNQTRPGISHDAPKLSFHIGFLVFGARGGFPGCGMLGSKYHFLLILQKVGERHLVGWSSFLVGFGGLFCFLFFNPWSQVKPFFNSKPTLELQYLFNPSSSSEENHGRTQQRGQNATSRSAHQRLLAFPRVRMVWDSSRINLRAGGR